jgi:hypothetical protein
MQTDPEGFVDNLLERASGAARGFAKLVGDVFVER